MALADPALPCEGLLGSETAWRRPPYRWERGSRAETVAVSRWTAAAPTHQECTVAAIPGCHVLEVHLRPTNAALTVDGISVHDGRLAAGSALLTRAESPVSARYRSACDLLRLFVPIARFEALLAAAGIAQHGRTFGFTQGDRAVARLALSLLEADDLDGPEARLFAESIGSAILARVLGRPPAAAAPVLGERTGLVRWRLKRVLDFIEANLSEPIRLPDLARAAGLSRMHFAAQFRIATGLRPHEYVVRRRIERAQELARDTALPLAQIALAAGFQTQAHFTTVFKEHVHDTPGRWRQVQRAG